MDENYADIYYVDTRNATTDHRTGSSSSPFRTPPSPFASAPSGRTVIVNPANSGFVPGPAGGFVRPSAYAPGYPSPYGMTYPGQPYPGYPGYPAQTPLGSLFGNMGVGQILDLVATAFAALAPLPTAPLATKDAVTDVGNMLLYQSALAEHAKRDERIRTIGSLVGKLVA